MATEQQVKDLQTEINSILELSKKQLVTRADWGVINFDAAQRDFQRIFFVANHLSVLPLDYLPDSAAEEIRNVLRDVKGKLTEVDNFRIDQGGEPTARRTSHVSQIHVLADRLFQNTASWLPFLAYQKGDVAKNIEALTDAVKQGTQIIGDAKGKAEKAETELGQIITRTREAAASAGAGVFTQEFLAEAATLQAEALTWLRITGLMAFGTVVLSLGLWWLTEEKLDQGQLVQKFGSKLVILVFMFTATLWCGRIYKALRHQAANNRHRGLSLKTFQAFTEAAHDPTTKNAVLMETTKCIFANTATGYIDQSGSGQDSDIKIIEVVKSVVSDKAKTGS